VTVVTIEYRVGVVSDQILGLVTVMVCAAVAVPGAVLVAAPSEVAGAALWATGVPVLSRIVLATVADAADEPSF
jgi:hypothetical protein